MKTLFLSLTVLFSANLFASPCHNSNQIAQSSETLVETARDFAHEVSDANGYGHMVNDANELADNAQHLHDASKMGRFACYQLQSKFIDVKYTMNDLRRTFRNAHDTYQNHDIQNEWSEVQQAFRNVRFQMNRPAPRPRVIIGGGHGNRGGSRLGNRGNRGHGQPRRRNTH